MSDPQSTPTRSETGPDARDRALPAGIHRAVARGALYRLAAQGFRTPDEHWLEALQDPAQDVVAIGFAEAWSAAEGAPVISAIERLLDALPEPQAVAEIADLHRRLFGHTVAAKCPLYETEYGQWGAFQQPHTLADMAGAYRAFGLIPSADVPERPDHLCLECEFLYVLSHKEAWAHQHDGPAEVEVCHHARRVFLKNHLGRWLPSLASRLARHAPETFYARLGDLLMALVGHDCRALNVPLGDRDLAVGCSDRPPQEACTSCDQSCGPVGATVLGVGTREGT